MYGNDNYIGPSLPELCNDKLESWSPLLSALNKDNWWWAVFLSICGYNLGLGLLGLDRSRKDLGFCPKQKKTAYKMKRERHVHA